MSHPRILNSKQAVLIIVDVQENFRKYIPDITSLASNIVRLVEGSKILEIPVVLAEQYPQGLGKTISEITSSLGEHQYVAKTTFSCCQAEGFMNRLSSLNRNQIIICGIEAHVCVNQTAHDLLENGYQVHVVYDAISSRYEHNTRIGWEKMISSGAIPSSCEMALCEMLVRSSTEQFKAVQRLLKNQRINP